MSEKVICLKVKNIGLALMVLVLILGLAGCNTQAKKNIADENRLLFINEKIDALFNEDKTDIVEDITDEQIEEIDSLLAAERENQFSEDNLLLIDDLLYNLDTALDMAEFEYKVDALFDGMGGVLKDAYVDVLEINLETYEEKSVFYNRQKDKIIDAKEQLVMIAEITEIVEALFIDGELDPDVDLEREREVRELVTQIKSQEIRRELDNLLVQVASALTKDKMEYAAAQREAAEARRIEEERRQAAVAAEKPETTIPKDPPAEDEIPEPGTGNDVAADDNEEPDEAMDLGDSDDEKENTSDEEEPSVDGEKDPNHEKPNNDSQDSETT